MYKCMYVWYACVCINACYIWYACVYVYVLHSFSDCTEPINDFQDYDLKSIDGGNFYFRGKKTEMS